jgi:PIN domain nuclease of toxin-antitoxin system
MTRPVLLDTCALLWVANSGPLKAEAEQALGELKESPAAILVSPISSWEIGQLVARGRLVLPMDPLSWFQTVLASGVMLSEMPPSVLVASSFLPGPALRDPADKIIAATARAYGYRLMTRDRPLLDLGDAGHIQTIAC